MLKSEVDKIIHVLAQHFMQPDVQQIFFDELDNCGVSEPGWYFRLSAPGYLDCTDWTGPYETEEEANEALAICYEDEVEA